MAVGQNILLHSLRIQASDFISPDDDVSLIDFVENDPIKKIWRCSDVKNSDMLSLCIMTSYNESAKMDKKQFSTQPSWLAYLEKKALPNSSDENNLQFLGLMSLYQNNTGSKVYAFQIHSFMLYLIQLCLWATWLHFLYVLCVGNRSKTANRSETPQIDLKIKE